MPFRLDKWLVVVMVAALSTLSWWLPLEQHPASALIPTTQVEHVIDVRLQNFELTAMNAAGRPRYRLQAASLRHYADDDTAQLTAPRLKVFRKDGPPWWVQSQRAEVATAGASVLLKDDVQARRLTEVPGDQLALYTSVLKVIPDRQYAETAAPVTLVTDQGVTRGVGLEADFKRQQYQLLAQVRGEYAGR
jgi:lipopolysaccharide export system protein LptC